MIAPRFLLVAILLAGCVPGETPSQPTSGAQDFTELCAPCHGASGKGNGELAPGLAHKPADLTGLAKRNGGTFPMARVMSKIWGYSHGGAPGALMPKFAPLMDGPTVLVDTGDGIQTPTPQRLVEIANYLTTIQGK
ncbi:MAG: c-type cytochrome [Cypionkella sp.]